MYQVYRPLYCSLRVVHQFNRPLSTSRPCELGSQVSSKVYRSLGLTDLIAGTKFNHLLLNIPPYKEDGKKHVHVTSFLQCTQHVNLLRRLSDFSVVSDQCVSVCVYIKGQKNSWPTFQQQSTLKWWTKYIFSPNYFVVVVVIVVVFVIVAIMVRHWYFFSMPTSDNK